eukprot:1055997-Pelagomonas_calceolata.AAC.1
MNETHGLKGAMSPLYHEATKKKGLVGIWRVTGSTHHQNLAVRSRGSSPYFNKGKGTHWLRRALNPLHLKDYNKNILIEIWRLCWTSVGCCACCVTHGVSRRKKKKKKKKKKKRLPRQSPPQGLMALTGHTHGGVLFKRSGPTTNRQTEGLDSNPATTQTSRDKKKKKKDKKKKECAMIGKNQESIRTA